LLTTSGPSHDFVRQITSFANHPQFAVLRGGPSESQIAGEDLGPGEGHRVYEVAERVASSLPWTWRDKANLRFNHQSHLHPDGVLVPPSHAEYGDGKTFKRLACSDCHVPDDDGRYMRPINYESHCMACHSLDFSTKLHQIDASLDLTGPLPHVEPQLIRGLLRDRLMAYARKHPDVVRGEPIPEAPRMPGKSLPTASSAKDEWEWVETQMAQVAQVIAGTADIPRPGRIDFTRGCLYCHILTHQAGTDPAAMLDWNIEPPNIPARWMPHSRFRHESHRPLLECTECHKQAAHSTQTSDVLLPSVATCQQCHNTSRGWAGGARSDCIECHTYHSCGVENSSGLHIK
jgi:hypothetical protein